MKKYALAFALSSLFASGAFAAGGSTAMSGGITWDQPKILVAGEGDLPPAFGELRSDKVKGSKLDKVNDIPMIRAEAIQEAAASLGARGGLARKLHEAAAELNKNVDHLDALYDFTKVALSVPSVPGDAMAHPNPYEGNGEFAMILPPVILDGHDADSFPSEDEMRIASRTYKIHQKARLIPVEKKTGYPIVPNWREYLVFSYPEVQWPHESLLPRSDGEKSLWDEWVKKGWEHGQLQGARLLEDGWSRLNRDFHGMLKYRLAYGQGLVSRPQIAGVYMGVTGGGQELRLNDRVVRITDHSSFVANPNRWSTTEPK